MKPIGRKGNTIMVDGNEGSDGSIDYETDELDDIIFDFLQEGRTPQSVMYKRTDYSKMDFFHRLQTLQRLNLVWKFDEATATYELIEDPRDPEYIQESMESRDFLPSREWSESEESEDSDDVEDSGNSPNSNNGTEHNPGHEGK